MNSKLTVWTASTRDFNPRKGKGKANLLNSDGDPTGIVIMLQSSSSRLVKASENGPYFSAEIDTHYPESGNLVVFTGPHDWDGKSPCVARIWGSKSLWDKYQNGDDSKPKPTGKPELTVLDGGKGEDYTEADGPDLSPEELFRRLRPPATGQRVQGYHTGRHR